MKILHLLDNKKLLYIFIYNLSSLIYLPKMIRFNYLRNFTLKILGYILYIKWFINRIGYLYNFYFF